MDPTLFHAYSKKPVVHLSSSSSSSSSSSLGVELNKHEVEILNGLADRLDDVTIDDDSDDAFLDSEPCVAVIKALEKTIQDYKDNKVLPDLILELILKNKLNIMILDLYNYKKGFEISFLKFGSEEEMFHGAYSYGVGLIDYIKDCEIPYELFDHLSQYQFQLLYDGCLICQLRIHFDQVDNMQSHFVLLRHSIQSIDAECAMNCKNDKDLNFDSERARLIQKYSPDLYLDPNLFAAECFEDNILNEFPFLSPELKHHIYNKKADLEEGLKKVEAAASRDELNGSKWTSKEKVDPFEGTSKETYKGQVDPCEETSKETYKGLVDLCEGTSQEAFEETSKEQVDPCEGTSEETCDRLTALIKKFEACEWNELRAPSSNIASYLIERKVCIPDLEHFRFSDNVEIESFVFEYTPVSNTGTLETIRERLSVSVMNTEEYYYVAYQPDNTEELRWSPIGRRNLLDLFIDDVARENMMLNKGELKIVHIGLFDDHYHGTIEYYTEKLDFPSVQLILHWPAFRMHEEYVVQRVKYVEEEEDLYGSDDSVFERN
ncbi:uncharacterized protein LOC129958328 isoform X2 [Argiope bruennichi]|uniref:uncharacterized protein LOC129958328 isoform X2 n=1 Tax=Argiope bruennichi TaxID=94029 RepID=UPI002494EC43|nr:uncharacterized protein LOC129958328 isoform X2 [Argiope bruennichi]